MSLLDKQPAPGYGFIYVLSNPQFKKNVFKVGLTTNSPAQRIGELSSTTGIPTKFQLEALYEVPESKLKGIEKSAHLRLTELGHHVGKEFFDCDREVCMQSVEDAILARWSDAPLDLVAEAREREALRKANWEKQEAKRRAEEELSDKKRKDIEEKRKLADRRRDAYVSTEMDKVFWVRNQFSIFYIFGFVCLAIWSDIGGVWSALIFVALIVFFKIWVSSLREDLQNKSALMYPYSSSGVNVEGPQASRVENTKTTNAPLKPSNSERLASSPGSTRLAVFAEGVKRHSREDIRAAFSTRITLGNVTTQKNKCEENEYTNKIEPQKKTIYKQPDYDDYVNISWDEGWYIDVNAGILYNTLSGEVLKTNEGTGYSVSTNFYLLYNKKSPRKLPIGEQRKRQFKT